MSCMPISPRSRRLEAWAHREKATGLCWSFETVTYELVVIVTGLWAEKMGWKVGLAVWQR